MQFDPDAVNPLTAGEYDFVVSWAEEKISASGNEMMVVKMVAGTDGNHRPVTDYILARNAFKLRMFAKSCGMLDQFLSGELLPKHLPGRRGRVVLAVEESKDLGEPGRNKVDRYVVGR